MQIYQSIVGRERLCVVGGHPEPVVESNQLLRALADDDVERYRALLPVGYRAAVAAYRQAAASLEVENLTDHYSGGLDFFHDEFVPHVKSVLLRLSGGQWDLSEFKAFAAGTDVDLIAHIINGVSSDCSVSLYPGDWYGFLVGCSNRHAISWTRVSIGSLACLCIPSVRNGHCTSEMMDFLTRARACLLNINLYPTLSAVERSQLACSLSEILPKALIVISFSRGFGLTASQLGLVLIHPQNPFLPILERQLSWFTYFYNAIAARAFKLLDHQSLDLVNDMRRQWVERWLNVRGLPAVQTGSYYVKSFQIEGEAPSLSPLTRDGILRLCLKPPIF